MPFARRYVLLLSAGLILSGGARAATDLSDASLAVSALPVASVVLATAAVSTVAVTVPVALSEAGATLVVRGVRASAKGTVYLLERAADGSQASVEVTGRMALDASAVIGKTVTVSTIAAGTLLSAAGEVIAFIPNQLGKALLHDERITR